jgi:hypothetical protein
MRRKLILAVLLALAAPAVWLGSGGNDGKGDDDLGFGKQIAGGWVATLDIEGGTIDVLMTLGADGNVVVSGQLRWAGDDNRGGWENTRFNTTAHGSWQRTGRNDIKVLGLLQVQDNDGNLVFYEKITMQMALNKAGTRLEGTGSWQLIRAGNDPLDPKAPVAYGGPFTETLRPIR